MEENRTMKENLDGVDGQGSGKKRRKIERKGNDREKINVRIRKPSRIKWFF